MCRTSLRVSSLCFSCMSAHAVLQLMAHGDHYEPKVLTSRCAAALHAGLKVSKGSEERSSTDPSSMFAAIDGWAQSVQPSLALQPLASPTGFAAVRTSSLPTRASNTGLLSARQSAGGGQAQGAQPAGSNTSSRRTSSAGRSSTGGSRPVSNEGARLSANLSAKQLPAQPGGAAAIAARLAAGCCPEAPYRQLQLLRACYCWVLTHVRLPRDCDMEAGVELVTWDVGRHVFGEGHKQALLQEVRTGTSITGYSLSGKDKWRHLV